MNKKVISFTVIFALIILAGNTFEGLINFAIYGVGRRYSYETFDGKYKFSYLPAKGGKLERVELQFKELQQDFPKYKDTKLVRTFKMKPLQFWNWYSYLFSEKYAFQYKEPSGTSIHVGWIEDQ
jgi:hypothetical protein